MFCFCGQTLWFSINVLKLAYFFYSYYCVFLYFDYSSPSLFNEEENRTKENMKQDKPLFSFGIPTKAYLHSAFSTRLRLSLAACGFFTLYFVIWVVWTDLWIRGVEIIFKHKKALVMRSEEEKAIIKKKPLHTLEKIHVICRIASGTLRWYDGKYTI